MSRAAIAAERFAEGEPVLVGDENGIPAFVAAPAQTLDGDRLERLQSLGGGMVVLALEESIAAHLHLPPPTPWTRSRVALPFTASVDAARVNGGGWSVGDRALTMRVAADPEARPSDLTIPGHVLPARIETRELVDRDYPAAAALELARISGRRQAVAVSALVDSRGRLVSLSHAREDWRLAALPVAPSSDLRALARAARAAELAVSCNLPTRDGIFRISAHLDDLDGISTLSLVHGDPRPRRQPLVHVHRACLFGDAFGSLACPCRAELELAIDEITDEGAGILVYVKAADSAHRCGRTAHVDTATVAGLLSLAGIESMRLGGRDEQLSSELRKLGFELAPSAGERSAA